MKKCCVMAPRRVSLTETMALLWQGSWLVTTCLASVQNSRTPELFHIYEQTSFVNKMGKSAMAVLAKNETLCARGMTRKSEDARHPRVFIRAAEFETLKNELTQIQPSSRELKFPHK